MGAEEEAGPLGLEGRQAVVHVLPARGCGHSAAYICTICVDVAHRHRHSIECLLIGVPIRFGAEANYLVALLATRSRTETLARGPNDSPDRPDTPGDCHDQLAARVRRPLARLAARATQIGFTSLEQHPLRVVPSAVTQGLLG